MTRATRDLTIELERNAYNAAFHDLGLHWCWDDDTFAGLLANPDPHARLCRYIETQQPHLLRAYDLQFLVEAIEARKTGFQAAGASTGGAALSFDWAQACGTELGA
ncbi:MAG TPA: hypothetical protein VF169_02535 [Albitalea sp.]|uniref:hypothetical protein n=1 Tax=Piscinibacter sp. TaxID=1903157 RepID=UPI002ECFD538